MIQNGEVPDITLPPIHLLEVRGPVFEAVDPVKEQDQHQKVLAKQTKRRSVHALNAAQRRQKAMELRLQGLPQSEIAEKLGVTQPVVSRLIQKAYQDANELQADRVEQYRRLQGERLDAFLKAIWPRIAQGDVLAVAQAIKIEERRAKLLGLDAPQRVQVGLDLEALPDAQLRGIAERLGMTLAAPAIPQFSEADVIPSIVWNALPVVEVVSESGDSMGESGGEGDAEGAEPILDQEQDQGLRQGFGQDSP